MTVTWTATHTPPFIYSALRPETPQLPKPSLSLASKKLSTWLVWSAPKAILPIRKKHPNSISEDTMPELGWLFLPSWQHSFHECNTRGSKGPKVTPLLGAGSVVVPTQYLILR